MVTFDPRSQGIPPNHENLWSFELQLLPGNYENLPIFEYAPPAGSVGERKIGLSSLNVHRRGLGTRYRTSPVQGLPSGNGEFETSGPSLTGRSQGSAELSCGNKIQDLKVVERWVLSQTCCETDRWRA
ncbi:unnamed protein product [Sphagnum jensenii]|uniref:Uncharacterized protein n=1 Tax=Sphagnum jensenii TaxID=128206 RepID=A0ABP0W5K3_9BRYO